MKTGGLMRQWGRGLARSGVTALLAVFVGTGKADESYHLDGEPTAAEEEIRWLLNRGRFDRDAENRLRGTAYTDVPQRSGPLAPHQSLILSSRRHSEDMARNNQFQHDTIQGSAFYDPVSQPKPWDRMRAEGYTWNGAAENIAAGYGTPAGAYLGWWNSTGHRLGMFNAGFREVGVGIFVHSPSQYVRYYTMNLGHRRGGRFFTDTVFQDRNRNGIYDSGEGVGGVRVVLAVGGRDWDIGDESGEAGAFAVPTGAIPVGSRVEVYLANGTSVARPLTLPVTHAQNREVVVPAGGRWWCGTWVADGERNVGFRDLSWTTGLQLVRAPSGEGWLLAWDTEANARYRVMVSSNLVAWSILKDGLPGTGTRVYEPVGQAGPQAYYRIETGPVGP